MATNGRLKTARMLRRPDQIAWFEEPSAAGRISTVTRRKTEQLAATFPREVCRRGGRHLSSGSNGEPWTIFSPTSPKSEESARKFALPSMRTITRSVLVPHGWRDRLAADLQLVAAVPCSFVGSTYRYAGTLHCKSCWPYPILPVEDGLHDSNRPDGPGRRPGVEPGRHRPVLYRRNAVEPSSI